MLPRSLTSESLTAEPGPFITEFAGRCSSSCGQMYSRSWANGGREGGSVVGTLDPSQVTLNAASSGLTSMAMTP